MKIKTGWLYFFVFLLIIAANGVLYWGFQHNYFFSDDFHWLGRAVLAQDSPGEIFKIEGRDFNPVYMLLLGILIKIFGLSPLVLRLISLLTFSAVIWMFFYILCRYFKVNIIIALSAALLSSFNVFVSEVVLNLAALVYSLSILLFLVALKFYFDQKQWLYSLFLFLAFLTKETIILAAFPLFFYEKEKNLRWFIVASTGSIVLFRVLLQMTAAAASYTGFLSFSNFFYKLYFIILRTMNLSPYSIGLPVGIIVIIMLVLVSVYFIKGMPSPTYYGVCQKNKVSEGINEKGRGFLFFLLLPAIFSLFFSLLPKLSSRYFFYPTFGFWGIAALLTQYFYQRGVGDPTLFTVSQMPFFRGHISKGVAPPPYSRSARCRSFGGFISKVCRKNKVSQGISKKRYLQFALVPLLLVSVLFNYSPINREIEDYKILGDFSRTFIQNQAVLIKNQLNNNPLSPGITIYNPGNRQLAAVYQQVIKRKNLPKLLPFRQNSIGGVIEPKHLVPIIFYPDKVARWELIEETPYYFKGRMQIP